MHPLICNYLVKTPSGYAFEHAPHPYNSPDRLRRAPHAQSFITNDTPEIRRINNNANSEHYALLSRGSVFEVIERAGSCPVPLQFFIDFGESSFLTSARDESYPYESVGVAKLKNGVIIAEFVISLRTPTRVLRQKRSWSFPRSIPRISCATIACIWLSSGKIGWRPQRRSSHPN